MGEWRRLLNEELNETPTFQDSRQVKLVRLSALRTGRLYLQEKFLVLISARGWFNPRVHTAVGRIMSMKNSSDTTGNQTPDLPACNEVPRPTAPPRAPSTYTQYVFFSPEER